jgi:Fe-S oxidoreductase
MATLFGEGGTEVYKGVVAVWAVLVSIGIVGLAFRRFVLVKISPDPKSWSSGVVALFILALMLTFLYSRTGPAPGPAKVNWWLHAALILGFPPLILRSKHFHLVMAPFDIFFRTHRTGDLKPLNLDIEALEESDEEPYLGLESLGQVSWKQRMDFYTCVECRRCTDNCPANLSGQELDPRGFILAGRAAIQGLGAEEPVIGNVLSEKALGQCTTCGACEANCPVGIEHLQVLIGAKQAQAMATGVGMVATEFLKTVERAGNPFAEPKDARTRLIEELGIPLYQPGETEYLLWLGCVWAYNRDARGSLESMVKILRAAGVSFGVLARESCSGHHSRRQGEELQFQTLAQENLEHLRGAAKIVAPCPHCLHTIGREYPELDPEFQPTVIHHSELIEELLARGALRLDPAKRQGQTATYHDPCYPGRFEEIYDAPRRLIGSAGLKVVEMERHGPKSMCCGGGGGGFAREIESEPARVDQKRKDQVKQTGARLLVTACPECKMMLGAAVEETQDLAELVAESMA